MGYSGASQQRSVQVAELHVFKYFIQKKKDLVNMLDYGSKQTPRMVTNSDVDLLYTKRLCLPRVLY